MKHLVLVAWRAYGKAGLRVFHLLGLGGGCGVYGDDNVAGSPAFRKAIQHQGFLFGWKEVALVVGERIDDSHGD
jgi:hypothetical protein